MYKSVALSFTAILLCAGMALAQSSGTVTKHRTMVLKGAGAEASTADMDPVTGACKPLSDSSSWAWVDRCTGTNCDCYDISPAKLLGSGLKGSTVTDFFVTIDNDINPATAPAVDGGPDPVCHPIFGVVVVTDKDSNVTTANLMGVQCKHVRGTSKSNPAGNHDKDLMLGGWGIDSSDLTQSGWGTFTGKVNHNTSAVSLKLQGWITMSK
jgi:hypothetical protein